MKLQQKHCQSNSPFISHHLNYHCPSLPITIHCSTFIRLSLHVTVGIAFHL